MKISKTNLILYSILAVLSVSTIYSFVKNRQLHRELEENTKSETSISEILIRSKALSQIDSMLVKGQYKSAINAYKQQYGDIVTEGNRDIKFRIELAEQLLELSDDISNEDSTSVNGQLSNHYQNSNLEAPTGIRKYDSLNFVLKKTRVQLEKMKKLLQKKSYGTYLTFKNTKKHKVHYVGQVKREKANGYGVAILDTGSRYEGEWLNNVRHGEGSFYWVDGEYYVGQYENDRRNGKGSYFWPNGEKYVGGWKNDQRDGEGIFYNKDGKIVTKGIWKNDKLIKEEKTNK